MYSIDAHSTPGAYRSETLMSLVLTSLLDPTQIWRGSSFASGPSGLVLPTGHARLDAQLPGGGWSLGGLTELLHASPLHSTAPLTAVMGLRLLGPALSTLSTQGRELLLIAPPWEPHAPAWQALGVQLQRLLVVRPQRLLDALWSAEQALRAQACGGVLLWVTEATPAQLRRLQVVAQGSDAAIWVHRPLRARADASPAPTRLTCRALAHDEAEVEVFKRRSAAPAAPVRLHLPPSRPLQSARTTPRDVVDRPAPAPARA
jgi:protein ImuA